MRLTLVIIIINTLSIFSNDFIKGYLEQGESYGEKAVVAPLDVINTKGLEYGPVLSSDEKILFFISDRKGSMKSDKDVIIKNAYYKYPKYSKNLVDSLIDYDPYFNTVKILRDYGLGFKGYTRGRKDSAYFATVDKYDPDGFKEFRILNESNQEKIRFEKDKFQFRANAKRGIYFFEKDRSICFDYPQKIVMEMIWGTIDEEEAREMQERSKVVKNQRVYSSEASHDFWGWRIGTDEIFRIDDYFGAQLNTEFNEGAMTISSNSTEIIYTACQKDGGTGSCDLYYYKMFEEGYIGNFMPVGINTPNFESMPSLTQDGMQLVWVSTRSGPNSNGDETLENFDIWYSNKAKGFWSEPANLSFINTKGAEQTPQILDNGNAIIFSSDGYSPSYGGADFYICINDNGKWTDPINLGPKINTEKDELFINISDDGKTAYLSRAKEKGNIDIYKIDFTK